MSPRPFRAVQRMPVAQRPAAFAPCSKLSKRCASATDYRHRTADCCRNWQIEIMRCVAPLFAELGVRWWLDYGSLLGAIRNPLTTWKDYQFLKGALPPDTPIRPGILPHDKDGDCGVLAEDRDKVLALQNRVQDAGWHFTYLPTRGGGQFSPGDRVKIRVSAVNHTNVDLFFWERRTLPDGTVERYRNRYIGADRYKGREFPESKLLPLRQLEWEEMHLPVPAEPEWFCELRYSPGQDAWQRPLPTNHAHAAIANGAWRKVRAKGGLP